MCRPEFRLLPMKPMTDKCSEIQSVQVQGNIASPGFHGRMQRLKGNSNYAFLKLRIRPNSA
jgi:hypothetical protein